MFVYLYLKNKKLKRNHAQELPKTSTTVLLPIKSLSNDDSGFKHGFGTEASVIQFICIRLCNLSIYLDIGYCQEDLSGSIDDRYEWRERERERERKREREREKSVCYCVCQGVLCHQHDLMIYLSIYLSIYRCPWCNGYRHRIWTRRYEFNSWTRLIAFHIALIPLGKV